MNNKTPEKTQTVDLLTMYDLRGEWAENSSKEIILKQLNKKIDKSLKTTEVRVRAETFTKIKAMRPSDTLAENSDILKSHQVTIDNILKAL